MLPSRRRSGFSSCRIISGIVAMAKGVMAMLTSDSTKVRAAAKASRVFARRVNCNAIGVPGIAASNIMPILASGVSGKIRTNKNPTAGINMQFANSVRTSRRRSRTISSNSPPVVRRPIESITTTTKKLSSGKGRMITSYPALLGIVVALQPQRSSLALGMGSCFARTNAGASLPLVANSSSQVGKKLLHNSESDIAAHRDTETDGRGPRRALARRQPRSREKRASRHSAQLRKRDVAASIVVPREDPALQRIARARPKPAFAGVEIAIVFVEQAAQPERHRALNRILPQDVRVSLPVGRRPLSPLLGVVVPLIDPGGQSRLDKPERIDHRLQVDLRSLLLR